MVTVNCNIAPDYFLDQMDMAEVDACIKAYIKNFQNAWEQTRAICFFVASSQSVKELQITKLMPFPWDEKEISNEGEAEKLTYEDIKQLKIRSEEIKAKLFSKIT